MIATRFRALSPSSKVFVHRALSPRTVFAETSDGEFVHIDHTSTGTRDLICPDCQRVLFARHYISSDRADHFYHASDESGGSSSSGECRSSGETALHLLAKEVISASKSLSIPAITASYRGATRRVRDTLQTTLLSADLEQSLGCIRPDALVRHKPDQDDEDRLAIEIYVTHAADNRKIETFQEMGLDAIEIDLSRIERSLNLEELTDLVLHSAPRKWLHNRSAEKAQEEIEADWQAGEKLRQEARAAALALENARKAAAQEEARQRALRVQTLLSAWERPIPDASEEDLEESKKLVIDLIACGLEYCAPKPQSFDQAFSVEYRIWKAGIIREFADKRQGHFTVYDVLDYVRWSGQAKPELVENIRGIDKECWSQNNDFKSVFAALVEFLSTLVRGGLLKQTRDGSTIRYHSCNLIAANKSMLRQKYADLLYFAKCLGERGYHIAIGGAVLKSPSQLIPFLAEVVEKQKQTSLLEQICQLGRALQPSSGELPWWIPNSYPKFDVADKVSFQRHSAKDVIKSILNERQDEEKFSIRKRTRAAIKEELREHPSSAAYIATILGEQNNNAGALDALESVLEKELTCREDFEQWTNTTKNFVNKVSSILRFLSAQEPGFCDHMRRDIVRYVLEMRRSDVMSIDDFERHLRMKAGAVKQQEAPIRRDLALLYDRIKTYGRNDFLTRRMAARLSIENIPSNCKELEAEIMHVRMSFKADAP